MKKPDLTKQTKEPEYKLGTRYIDKVGTPWRYIQFRWQLQER